MKSLLVISGIMATALAAAAQAAPQQDDGMKSCPMHEQHQSASAAHDHAKHDMNKRGDQGMGFSQEKTTHHFLLAKDGGAIQVTANSAADKASIQEIQMHLGHIAEAFQAGDFDIPMFVHDKTPDGVPVMRKLRDQIKYSFESLENGGRVVISSKNADAVAAVQEFLKFQIKEHETGDIF